MPPEIVFVRTAVASLGGGSTCATEMPTSLALNVLPETATLPSEPKRSIPVDVNPEPVYAFPLTLFPETVATAPRLICIPFWATTFVGPTPVIVFPVIVAAEPALSTMIPVFW